MEKGSELILTGLDLEPIIVKAVDTEEGLGWSLEHSFRVADEYRRFWVLCFEQPDEAVVPSSLVDDFWHQHILDTEKYAEDCDKFLGYFLHHFPYFGMRGGKDAHNLRESWKRTKELYGETFGESLPAELWPHANRCPRCGRRVNDDIAMIERPTLAEIGLTA